MKKLMIVSLFVAMGACAQVMAAKPAQSRKADLESVVRDFAKGGDARDVQVLERVLDKEFRVVLSKGDEAPSLITRDQYIGLIKAKKIGGSQRALKIEWTDVRGSIGFVSAELKSGKAHFKAIYTLVKKDGAWRIIQDAVLFSLGA